MTASKRFTHHVRPDETGATENQDLQGGECLRSRFLLRRGSWRTSGGNCSATQKACLQKTSSITIHFLALPPATGFANYSIEHRAQSYFCIIFTDSGIYSLSSPACRISMRAARPFFCGFFFRHGRL
jgi:hypothetical protein